MKKAFKHVCASLAKNFLEANHGSLKHPFNKIYKLNLN